MTTTVFPTSLSSTVNRKTSCVYRHKKMSSLSNNNNPLTKVPFISRIVHFSCDNNPRCDIFYRAVELASVSSAFRDTIVNYNGLSQVAETYWKKLNAEYEEVEQRLKLFQQKSSGENDDDENDASHTTATPLPLIQRYAEKESEKYRHERGIVAIIHKIKFHFVKFLHRAVVFPDEDNHNSEMFLWLFEKLLQETNIFFYLSNDPILHLPRSGYYSSSPSTDAQSKPRPLLCVSLQSTLIRAVARNSSEIVRLILKTIFSQTDSFLKLCDAAEEKNSSLSLFISRNDIVDVRTERFDLNTELTDPTNAALPFPQSFQQRQVASEGLVHIAVSCCCLETLQVLLSDSINCDPNVRCPGDGSFFALWDACVGGDDNMKPAKERINEAKEKETALRKKFATDQQKIPRQFAIDALRHHAKKEEEAASMNNNNPTIITEKKKLSIKENKEKEHARKREIFDLLFNHPSTNKLLKWRNLTCIYAAAQAGNAYALKKLLDDGTIDVNCHETTSGVFPLHVACSKGHLQCVKLLSEHPMTKCDFTARTLNQETALHAAAASFTFPSLSSTDHLVAEKYEELLAEKQKTNSSKTDIELSFLAKQFRENEYQRMCEDVQKRQIEIIHYLLFDNPESSKKLNIDERNSQFGGLSPLAKVMLTRGDKALLIVKYLVEVAKAKTDFSDTNKPIWKQCWRISDMAHELAIPKISEYLGYSLLDQTKNVFNKVIGMFKS